MKAHPIGILWHSKHKVKHLLCNGGEVGLHGLVVDVDLGQALPNIPTRTWNINLF